MKAGAVFRIVILAFAVAVVGRFAWITAHEVREDSIANELCGMVGNQLEIGSLREAFEGLQLGLNRSQMPNACVSVVDNGRSFSPDCLNPAVNYRIVVCRAEANKGVRAQISFPTRALFSAGLWLIWGLVAFFFIGALAAMRSATRRLTVRVTSEIESRLLRKSDGRSEAGFFGSALGVLLEKSGLSKIVHREISSLESRLTEFEAKARLEATLRAKQEAESAKSKEYLERVRQIRHDIRSPLSALFAARSAIVGDEALQKTLTSSIRGIEKMIEDLHQLEAAEAKPSLVIAEVILEEEISALRPKFRVGKGVSLFLEYNSDALSPVMAVADVFRRVIVNLLENAFDAVSAGGEIRVNVRSEGGACRIEVADNGCGVSPENIGRLFEKGATFGKVGGTGLGLYYARESLRRWNGDVSCEPLLKGACFAVTLPLAQAGVTFVGLPDDPQIWVIDDKPEVAAQLQRAGFEVERTASSAAEGRSLLSSASDATGMVLLDQNLGDGLGTDLALDAPKGAKIYLCTDNFDDPQTLSLARQRFLKVLPKPLCFLAAPGAAP